MKITGRSRIALLPFALTLCLMLGLALGTAGTAAADMFTFTLHNHPDGDAQPPPYGLRLDELVNVTAGHDYFTFNFDDASISAANHMKLVYDDFASTITISGKVVGGLVTAGAYTNPNWTGVWDVMFVYDTNVSSTISSPDFELEISPNSASNNGTIQLTTGPNTGSTFSLHDGPMDGGFSFRFNNTDDHRLAGHGLSGPETFVGWGWLTHGTGAHVSASDWIFTGEDATPPQNIPEPGSLALLASGVAAGLARRRKTRSAR